MAYEKTIWSPCDTVTSEKLNKIEDELENLSNNGSAGCFVVNITYHEPESGDDDSGDIKKVDLKASDTKGGLSVDSSYWETDRSYNEIVNAFKRGSLPIGVVHEVEYNSTEQIDTRGAIIPGEDESSEGEIIYESYGHLIFFGSEFDSNSSYYTVNFGDFANIIKSNFTLHFMANDADIFLRYYPSANSGGGTSGGGTVV